MWSKLNKIWKKINAHPQTKYNRIAALSRYIYWQLYSRFIGTNKIVNWGPILKIRLDKNTPSINAQYYFGLTDYIEMSFFLDFLESGDLFVDVGAYAGIYSLLAASKDAKVIAFEPIADSMEILKFHLELNGLNSKVECRQLALGKKSGMGIMTKSKGQQNRIIDQYSDGLEVNISTLDNEVLPIDSVTTIKIDAEGFELAILKGGSNLLNNSLVKVVMVEMMELGEVYGASDKWVNDYLIEKGFTLINYYPDELKIQKGEEISTGNALYMRDLGFINQRLARKKRFNYILNSLNEN